MHYLLFHKPYGVLTQFTDRSPSPRSTLADFIPLRDVYPAGRLDADSEGLLFLTDDGPLQHKLLNPRFGHRRTYLVQVEGEPSASQLEPLRTGLLVQGEQTRPAECRLIADPGLPPRIPPIRYRAAIPTAWIELTLLEGRNRQVRRMTAAAGFPTLRLVRWSIEHLTLAGLAPGKFRKLTAAEVAELRRRVSQRR